MWTNDGNFMSQEEIEKEQKYRKKQIKKVQDILDYGQFKYGCQFPKGFAARLYDQSYKGWIFDKRIIDSLVAEWRIWEPFVDKESFDKFIAHELKKMFKLHTTSTFSMPTLNQYIGKKANVIRDIPELMTTTVHMDGLVKFNGNEVKVVA